MSIIILVLIIFGITVQSLMVNGQTEVSDSVQLSSQLRDLYNRGKELLESIQHLSIRISGGRILNYIPTPREIFNFGKQTLIGLPQEIMAYVVHFVCNVAVKIGTNPKYNPNIDDMNFILLTPDNDNVTVPLKRAAEIWQHPKFRRDWNVVILVTGWNSNINETNEALEIIYEAYRCRNEHNFIVIDTGRHIDSLYIWSAFNTNEIGKVLAEALVRLSKYVPTVDNIHLIGHSLGAHICGVAGRKYTDLSGGSLSRITGLDPAMPCFNEGDLLDNLQRGDAKFVDIIHSNSGILGVRQSTGDVDFYPNGLDSLQPGCWSINCAHSRSYEFYAESVYPGNEKNFIATRCNSIKSLRAGRCGGRRIPMGVATPSSARGNYFLETNNRSPYGQSIDHDRMEPQCRNSIYRRRSYKTT